MRTPVDLTRKKLNRYKYTPDGRLKGVNICQPDRINQGLLKGNYVKKYWLLKSSRLIVKIIHFIC